MTLHQIQPARSNHEWVFSSSRSASLPHQIRGYWYPHKEPSKAFCPSPFVFRCLHVNRAKQTLVTNIRFLETCFEGFVVGFVFNLRLLLTMICTLTHAECEYRKTAIGDAGRASDRRIVRKKKVLLGIPSTTHSPYLPKIST